MAIANTKTLISTLVRNQLPEFIRNDYDTFVAFIEAYYEFLELQGGAMNTSKNLLEYLNVETTLDAFIEHFRKQYLTLIPTDAIPDKAWLIQHIKEFYRARGTEKALRFLFRLLYNEEIEIFYPKQYILKASGGNWITTKTMFLGTSLNVYATGDGVTTNFRVLDTQLVIGNIPIYVDETLQTSGYFISNNTPSLIFTAPPTANANIRMVYDATSVISAINDGTIIGVVTGATSGATAVTEKASLISTGGAIMMGLEVSNLSLIPFAQQESVVLRWTYNIDAHLFLEFHTGFESFIASITLIDGGASYNVADVIPITGGDPVVAATAIIEEVYQAVITNITIINGGCGVQSGQGVVITSSPNTGLNLVVSSVDTSGNVHPNSYVIVKDVISLYQNVIMSNVNYYFQSNPGANQNTTFANAFSTLVFGAAGPERLGPITGITIVSSTQSFISLPTFRVDAPIIMVTGNTANAAVATANVSLGYFGIMGRMNLITGGSNYTVGDELNFINQAGIGIGIGCAGEVTEVHSANNGVRSIRFMPSRLEGTANCNANTIVTGTGTTFNVALSVGDQVELNNETSYVASLQSNTQFTANVAFTRVTTARRVGVFGRYPIGGINYRSAALPTITITSAAGTGANILAEAVITTAGAGLIPSAQFSPGQIKSIKLTSPGLGYASTPIVDLTNLGNGRATAIAAIIESLLVSEGFFKDSAGLLSSDRKLQGQEYYYENYAYVVRTRVELNRYKEVVKALTHPAGCTVWGELMIDEEVSKSTFMTVLTANVEQFLL
jgi:hypothetical protein